MSAGGVLAAVAVPVVVYTIDPAVLQLATLVISVIIGPLVAWWVKRDVKVAITEVKAVAIEAKASVVEVKAALVESKDAVVLMEKQINSNMEKQMAQAVSKAIAEERLIVNVQATEKAKSDDAAFAKGVEEGQKKEPAAAPVAPVAPVTPPVIVVENVTAESVTADAVHAGILTTGAVKAKEKK